MPSKRAVLSLTEKKTVLEFMGTFKGVVRKASPIISAKLNKGVGQSVIHRILQRDEIMGGGNGIYVATPEIQAFEISLFAKINECLKKHETVEKYHHNGRQK